MYHRILSSLRTHCRKIKIDDVSEIPWEDAELIRLSRNRLERGDFEAWFAFIDRLQQNPAFAEAVGSILEADGVVQRDVDTDRLEITATSPEARLFSEHDEQQFLRALDDGRRRFELLPPVPEPTRKRRTEIMYLEAKPGLTGPGRIGRVRKSKTGRTVRYGALEFRSLKGAGYKANYYEVGSAVHYWISNCRKDGQDTLYPGIVHIDEDVRELYWTTIRNRPEWKHQQSMRSEGKYSKRRPS